MFWIKFLPLILTISSSLCQLTPYGVPLAKIAYYKPDHDFTCIDGSATLTWNKVNDDYCDCNDGSDEPGTSACENGSFYCQNKGFRPLVIPSSRVDDFICDCCDGSDEPQQKVACSNSCWALGKAAREEAKAAKQRFIEGNVIYQNYVSKVKQELENAEKEINEIKVTLKELKLQEAELKTEKEIVEAPESEAKKRFQEKLDEYRKKKDAAEDNEKARIAFKSLDENKDSRISREELKRRIETDSEAAVSDEDVINHLGGAMDVNYELFLTDVWTKIKDILKVMPEPVDLESEGVAVPSDEQLNDGKLKSDEVVREPEKMVEKKEDEEGEPVHDEETKKLIELADTARTKHSDVAQKVSQYEEKQKNLRDLVQRDYGPNKAFLPLAQDGQCFDYSDFEYTYRFCPFKSVTQNSKNDNTQTSLGSWGSWSTPYTQQIYENGQGCWNGPARSTKVDIVCDKENKVVKVEEPSRCVYRLVFNTPAACDKLDQEIIGDDRHMEL